MLITWDKRSHYATYVPSPPLKSEKKLRSELSREIDFLRIRRSLPVKLYLDKKNLFQKQKCCTMAKAKKTYIIFAFVTVQYVREGVWCEAERGQSLSTLVWCDNANVMLEVGHGHQCTLLARTANIIQCSASIPSHLQTVESGTFQKLPIKTSHIWVIVIFQYWKSQA